MYVFISSQLILLFLKIENLFLSAFTWVLLLCSMRRGTGTLRKVTFRNGNKIKMKLLIDFFYFKLASNFWNYQFPSIFKTCKSYDLHQTILISNFEPALSQVHESVSSQIKIHILNARVFCERFQRGIISDFLWRFPKLLTITPHSIKGL